MARTVIRDEPVAGISTREQNQFMDTEQRNKAELGDERIIEDFCVCGHHRSAHYVTWCKFCGSKCTFTQREKW